MNINAIDRKRSDTRMNRQCYAISSVLGKLGVLQRREGELIVFLPFE